MKYIYMVVALMFVACSDKSPELKKQVVENKIEVVDVAMVEEPVNVVVQPTIEKVRVETPMIEEPKVIKNIGSDVATSCAMWSDGCNVCTRVGGGKASCTTGPECKHTMFSCLQWQ